MYTFAYTVPNLFQEPLASLRVALVTFVLALVQAVYLIPPPLAGSPCLRAVTRVSHACNTIDVSLPPKYFLI